LKPRIYVFISSVNPSQIFLELNNV